VEEMVSEPEPRLKQKWSWSVHSAAPSKHGEDRVFYARTTRFRHDKALAMIFYVRSVLALYSHHRNAGSLRY